MFSFAVRPFSPQSKNRPIFEDTLTCTEPNKQSKACNTVTHQIMLPRQIFVNARQCWWHNYQIIFIFCVLHVKIYLVKCVGNVIINQSESINF